jgi:hypothetical protein
LLLSQWVAQWTPPATVGVDLNAGTGNGGDADQENPDGGHR